MTVAEKMADDFIVAAEGGPIAAELETLITTVAKRGRKRASKASTLALAYHPWLSMAAADAIEADKWEEEEA